MTAHWRAMSYSCLVQLPSTRMCRVTLSAVGWEERLKGCHCHREMDGTQMKTRA